MKKTLQFFAYDAKSPKIVWGLGRTRVEAIREAERYASEGGYSLSVIAIAACDSTVGSFVEENGGYHVPWRMKDAVAYIPAKTIRRK